MESTLPLYGLPFYKFSEQKLEEKLPRAGRYSGSSKPPLDLRDNVF